MAVLNAPYTVEPRKGRPPVKAPASGTPVALRYLHAFIAGAPNRRAATVTLLGCSKRMAVRLSNRQTLYTGRLPMSWVHIICAASGKPVGGVMGDPPKDRKAILVGWSGNSDGLSRLRDAADLGNEILAQAWSEFTLSGTSTVNHDSGKLRWVELQLHAAPTIAHLVGGMHRLILTLEKRKATERMYIRYIKPAPIGDSGFNHLTEDQVGKHLYEIHASTKDIATRLLRESERRGKNTQR